MSRKALGTLFILTGLVAVLPQAFPALEPFTLALLAVLYLTACVVYRSPGLAIPAGILTGLALGIGLESHPLSPGQPEGAAFFLGFAFGWLLIVLLSTLFRAPMRWAAIPAAVLGVLGLALLAGETGAALLALLGRFWPLVFVFIGLALLWRRRADEA